MTATELLEAAEKYGIHTTATSTEEAISALRGFVAYVTRREAHKDE
jgi:hypothetical protein